MKIEKNIPIPELPQKPSRPKAQFHSLLPEMKVGDSVLVENRSLQTVKDWLYLAERHGIIKRRNFHVAKDGDGYRVWRVS